MALLHSVQSLYLIVCLLCCLALNASAVAVNYTEPICGLTDLYDGDYTQDKKGPPVCFVLTNPDDATKKKTIFWPTVDEFSLLEVDESFGLSWLQKGEYTMVQVEVGGMVSEPKSLISTSGDNWVPFLTIIVDLDDGRLKSVGWDDGCFTCDSSDTNVCIDDNCGVAYDKCFNNSATDNTGKSQDCDLKIYIGWTGIGSDGNYLTSAAKKFSSFTKYSVGSAWSSASANAGGNPSPGAGDS